MYLYFTEHSSKDGVFLKSFVSREVPCSMVSCESAKGCNTYVGRQRYPNLFTLIAFPTQGSRLDTLGVPLSWALHSCRDELREFNSRPSCPVVSAMYSYVVCQLTSFVGLCWYDNSHQHHRVCSYVLVVFLGSNHPWGCVYRHHSFVLRSSHLFFQSLSLRVFNSEFRSQIVIRVLTRSLDSTQSGFINVR